MPSPVVPLAPDVKIAPAAAHPATAGPRTVSAAWVSHVAAAAGIPAPAVRAYGAATLRVNRIDPGCHLGWTTLAGIGWIESQHGTIGGRLLGEDGRSDRPVLGPVLDGRGGTAAVRSVMKRSSRTPSASHTNRVASRDEGAGTARIYKEG